MHYKTLALDYLDSDPRHLVWQQVSKFIATLQPDDRIIHLKIDRLPDQPESCFELLFEKLPATVVGLNLKGWSPSYDTQSEFSGMMYNGAIIDLVASLPAHIVHLDFDGLELSGDQGDNAYIIFYELLAELPWKSLEYLGLSHSSLDAASFVETLVAHIDLASACLADDEEFKLSTLDLSHNQLCQVECVTMSELVTALAFYMPECRVDLSDNLFISGDGTISAKNNQSIIEFYKQIDYANDSMDCELLVEFTPTELKYIEHWVAENKSSQRTSKPLTLEACEFDLRREYAVGKVMQLPTLEQANIFDQLELLFWHAYHDRKRLLLDPPLMLMLIKVALKSAYQVPLYNMIMICRQLPFVSRPSGEVVAMVHSLEDDMAHQKKSRQTTESRALGGVIAGFLLLRIIMLNDASYYQPDDLDAADIYSKKRDYDGLTVLMRVVTMFPQEPASRLASNVISDALFADEGQFMKERRAALFYPSPTLFMQPSAVVESASEQEASPWSFDAHRHNLIS